ncbi:MAG TPA: glucosidase [Candidatus Binatia bacterium]|nr:glucosidase [Candidatus Binatia bacterium]
MSDASRSPATGPAQPSFAYPLVAGTAEWKRLQEVPHGRAPWRHWGPYLAERAWGTVREDYSAEGDPWHFFPFDHARSRAFRWNEDGLGGICDDRQTLCLAFAFWNGVDPFLKERIFGLDGSQGNHGEDAKECWWYLDSTPTHSWMRWRYVYPQSAFPYARLVAENARRTRLDPEYELPDTGVLATGRLFEITADYAKASPEDILIELRVLNRGPDQAVLHLLPTLWFRNTWSWSGDQQRPEIGAEAGGLRVAHPVLGRRRLDGTSGAAALFCDNETNTARLWGSSGPAYPKDGINDHVVNGAGTVNPEQRGTKAALWYRLSIPAGATASIRLRLHDDKLPGDLGDGFSTTMERRRNEADEFYAALRPPGSGADEAMVKRQALAGMLWGKQFYHYDIERWLDGDPAYPAPPAERLQGRNHDWRHLDNRDVISMPDKWEYPWYASWDLGFHCVSLAHVDPEFAKNQLILICREWYMHPNGQLPAYEWNLSDVNPPVHAWAALRVFEIAGDRDYDFLERVFHKLVINFTWWVNRKDAEGRNVFAGGFLGLDNIGPFDRSSPPPVRGRLEQSDGTAWMAMYCLGLLEIALILADHDPTYQDIATKFVEHFTLIAVAMNRQGLWDQSDGFFYDAIHGEDGGVTPLRVRSMVGLVPLMAVTVLEPEVLAKLHDFRARLEWYTHNRPEVQSVVEHCHVPGHLDRLLLSIVDPDKLRRILGYLLDEQEFLSPCGLRSVSRWHAEHPFVLDLPGGGQARVDYEPGESRTGLFGGNSNWRGPVWFPLNYLVIQGLRRFHRYLGDGFTVECPTGSGRQRHLGAVADEICDRLVAIFRETGGRRRVFGEVEMFQGDPAWHDLLPFHEYFNGDTGAGLGASHQTGWTGLVADIIASRAVTPGG